MKTTKQNINSISYGLTHRFTQSYAKYITSVQLREYLCETLWDKKLKLFIPLILLLSSCSHQQQDGFKFISSSASNLEFNNFIPEHPTINILNFEYLYNGGGVGAGDFNKDGKIDLYFAGNLVENKLFLNVEGFEFKDVTETSGTAAKKVWSNGISVVDINNDTWPDIYVSVSSLNAGEQPKNLLFINQGNNTDGIPTFTEEAEKYGLASTKHSRHAAFFDYDRDGDLDVYVLNNIIDLQDPTVYRKKRIDGTATNNDQLFQNQGDGTFKDVSKEAGILFEGYGLGLAISDINDDGWADIYVANDYLSNDLLYINQQDGTFKNEIEERIKIQSKFAMGVSVADFNNTSGKDILVLDMLSATSNRLKRHVKASNYSNWKSNKDYNYQEQVARNTLQSNNGDGYFSEMAFHSGIYASDWSWSPLTADFNNDGRLDVYVTNGFPKDITELDFSDYREGANMALNKKKIFEKLVEEKVPNCLFLNQGNMKFQEQAKTWQLDKPSYSNGAIYADFDQNGKLDIVVNNINDNAFLLKNQSESEENYLQIQFPEDIRYSKAIGAKVKVLAKSDTQTMVLSQEYYLHKSYLSSASPFLHFGLGNYEEVVVTVTWADEYEEIFTDIPINQVFEIKPKLDSAVYCYRYEPSDKTGLKLTETPLVHQSYNQNDFFYQNTLPFSYSQLGPLVSAVDLNNDKKEEIIFVNESEPIIQVYQPQTGQIKKLENLIEAGVNGLLVLDLNGDEQKDIAVTYGGFGQAKEDLKQCFQIFLNDGNGNFQKSEKLTWSKSHSLSAIRGHDVDSDGDIDLFLGGTVSRNDFPISNASYLWINDLKNNPTIEDSQFESLGDLGIVMDALWTDIDDDLREELIVAAHLKPIQIFVNPKSQGQLEEQTAKFITNAKSGFWNGIMPFDYDYDGDMDYIITNLGTNTPLSSSNSPIAIAYEDIDNNGNVDAFVGFHFNGEATQSTFDFRNEVNGRAPKMAKHFADYQYFASIDFMDFLNLTGDKQPNKITVEEVQHQLLKNENGQLILEPLRSDAQISPVFGLSPILMGGHEIADYSGFLGGTNLSASREFWGSYNALDGLLLTDDLYRLNDAPKIKGDSRSIVSIFDNGKARYFITRVNQPMIEMTHTCISCKELPESQLENYKKQKLEFYYGMGFRTQSNHRIVEK